VIERWKARRKKGEIAREIVERQAKTRTTTRLTGD